MKQITIAGRLTRDAVLRRTQNGDAVLGFSVAVDDRNGREKTTLYFDCSLWGKRGEALEQYLRKGNPVTVAGDLSTREHEGKSYLTVRVSEVALQGGGEKQDRPPQSQPRQQSYAEARGGAPAHSSYGDAMDDDIPF